VIGALDMAVSKRNLSPGLLIHSDRGSQYASELYQLLLLKHGIICSMSGKGNCWGNAVMESFYRTLKVELMYQHKMKPKEKRKGIFSNTSKSSTTGKDCIHLSVTIVRRNTKG
jgi:putative transposase